MNQNHTNLAQIANQLDRLGLYRLASHFDQLQASRSEQVGADDSPAQELLSLGGDNTAEELRGIHWMMARPLDEPTNSEIDITETMKERHETDIEKSSTLRTIGTELARRLKGQLLDKADHAASMVMVSNPDVAIVLTAGPGVVCQIECAVRPKGEGIAKTQRLRFNLDLRRGPAGLGFMRQVVEAVLAELA